MSTTPAKAPDGKPWPNPWCIRIDTREQLPYGFASPLMRDLLGGSWLTKVSTLTTGDYAIARPVPGADDEVLPACRVERKSLPDFIGSVTARRVPFMAECARLGRECTAPLIVVEAPIECLIGSRSGLLVALDAALSALWSAIRWVGGQPLAPVNDVDVNALGNTHHELSQLVAPLEWEADEKRARRSSVSAVSLLGSTLSIMADYRVPVLFLPSREWAEYAAAWWMRRAWRRALTEDAGLLAEVRRREALAAAHAGPCAAAPRLAPAGGMVASAAEYARRKAEARRAG